MLAIGRARAKRGFGFGPDFMLAHQPGHAVFTAGDLLSAQFACYTRAAIGLATLLKDLANLLQELLVGLGAWSRDLTAPLVVATAGHFQDPAEAANRVLGRQVADHGIPFCDGLEESMPRDFFRISRSCRTVSSSFFNLAFSSFNTE